MVKLDDKNLEDLMIILTVLAQDSNKEAFCIVAGIIFF